MDADNGAGSGVQPVRPATPEDAAEIARLLTLLEHPTTTEMVAARWDEWAAAGNVAFVTEDRDSTLTGLVTVHRVEITSNMRRADAHAFYQRIGYDRTSFRFVKSIVSDHGGA